jgi:eukaryotic-like serine/threonine-protein kinase
MVAPGQLLAGKYRVERVLGEGGMGLLVAATDLGRREQVALKMMRPEALGSPELVARFRREVETATRLTSPHVARVRDAGVLEGGCPYLVMELFDGEDLGAMLVRRGPLPVAEAVDVVLQACDALGEAHAMGIVHRDVSPANVFVARTKAGPVVKVLDFGVATAGPLDGAVSSMTRTGAVLGCPLYASPEQLQSSKHVDARADIWSLGAVLYELLTGRAPWIADSLGGLLGAVLLTEPASVREARPDVPPDLERVILRCLTRKREDRFATAADLAAALAPFSRPRPTLHPPTPAPGAAMGMLVVAIALLLALAIVAAAWSIKHRRSSIDERPRHTPPLLPAD